MDISFESITKVIKKYLAVILAVGLVFFGISFAYMKLMVAPTYYNTAKFYIRDTNTTTTTPQNVTTTRQLADTFVEILDTNSFFTVVHDKLAADPLTKDIADKYSVGALNSSSSFKVINETEIISVTFTSKNKDAVNPVLYATLNSLDEHLLVAYGDCSSHKVEMPNASPNVSSSKTTTVCLIATLVGIIAALIFFLIRDALDIHIKTVNDITERYNVSILGVVPEFDASVVKKSGSIQKTEIHSKSGEKSKEANKDKE
ncbi:MAG: hypothetical protein KBS44_04705 [Clostridiales bacterium]|nr:hypothetical protein [Candidatus Coliplasma equi]